MKNIFISYVRENLPLVEKLANSLTSLGVQVWFDKNNIHPGEMWSNSIKEGIENGYYFLACFSKEYYDKSNTYMNVELKLAIEQFNAASNNSFRIIPLRLNECNIPAIPISTDKNLNDIQWIDFASNWDLAYEKLIKVILGPSIKDDSTKKFVSAIVEHLKVHIPDKIKHISQTGVLRIKEIEDRWTYLVSSDFFNYYKQWVLDSVEQSLSLGKPITDFTVGGIKNGVVMGLTIVPNLDTKFLIETLPFELWANDASTKSYSQFIIEVKRKFRTLDDWDKRDFAHWIVRFDIISQKGVVDLLYLESLEAKSISIGFQQKLKESNSPHYSPHLESLYPTSIMSSLEASQMVTTILKEEIAIKYS